MPPENSPIVPRRQRTIPPEDIKIDAFLEEITRTLKNEGHDDDPLEKSAPKAREKVMRADQRYNKSKRKMEYLKSASSKGRMRRFTRCVVLVRTIIDSKGLPVGKKIDIKGTYLQNALNEVNKDIEGFTIDPADPEIDEYVLFHSRDRLKQMLKEELVADNPNPDLVFELEAGIEFIEEEFATQIASFETLSRERTITFKLLWMLFPSNSLIVSRDEFGQYWAAVVQKFEYLQQPVSKKLYFKLWYNYVDYNGNEIGVVGDRFHMKEFADKMTFESLPYCPLTLHSEMRSIRAMLLKQGQKALKLHKRCLVEYRGTALKKIEKGEKGEVEYDRFGFPNEKFGPKESQFINHGRVMLDPRTWRQTRSGDGIVPLSLQSIDNQLLTEEQTLTITPKLYGFSLGDKTWGSFACSQIEEVKWDADVLDALVLDQERKDLIHDLIEAHTLDDFDFDDFIRSKGKGLVGLLTGPPGVGKTMTAEAIAEIAHRPLYIIGSGELGDSVESIHEGLKSVMQLAELWDAVVLLDEADTFLCHRSDMNLTQNAVSSIFLRELEYYRGILILTTNRSTSIDSAFQSRIHFNIQYPDLNDRGRQSIWRNYLDRAEKSKRCLVKIDAQDYGTLSEMKLNGREIKNIMSISQAIAIRRGKPITAASIRSTMKLCQDLLDARVSQKSNGDIFNVL